MTWTWTAPVGVKLVLILAVIVCRFFRPPHPPTLLENIIHTAVFLAAFWTFWGSIIEYLVVSSLSVTRVVLRMDLVPQYGNMFLVIAASCWYESPSRNSCYLRASYPTRYDRDNLTNRAELVRLLYRSFQTMRIPVGDLIDILKVDVPEAPDVSLAGIRSDAATLEWSRPPSSRPVQKYVIQVNGVNVGNSGPHDTAITVTGLKPAHFYNIRVIAVGSNNFQSGSSVIRLRTYGKDSKPRLTNGRLPPSFIDQEQSRRRDDDQDPDSEPPKSPLPSIEATPAIDGSTSRDCGPTAVSNRRNTVSRRHSPSVASMDRPAPKDGGSSSTETQESLAELNEKFQRIRKEISDTVAQYEREEAEFKVQEDQLRKDLDQKRQALKEKESNTEQLRKRVNITGEQMRAAEKERAKKEQLLKDKKMKLQSAHDHIAKLETETESMRSKRDCFASKKAELDEFKSSKVADLDKDNSVLQEECSKLEAELKEKGKMLKELKLERQKLPGGDADERWRETDIQLKKEWEARRKMLEQRILSEMQRRHDLTANVRMVHNLIEQYRSHQSTLANPYIQGNQPAVEFVDPSPQAHLKSHGSRHSNSHPGSMLPPHTQLPLTESAYVTASAFGSRASFVPGPFVDVSTTADSFGHDQEFSSAEITSLTAGAPLSPTATSLIPAGILGDDDLPPSPSSEHVQSPFGRPISANLLDADPQSPASSNRSLSLMSSPQSSSQHLPFPPFPSEPGDRRSGGITSSPTAPAVQPSRFTSLFSPFQRARGAGKATDELGPPLGTLKPGQSRSFPRQPDDWDAANKRKTGLAGGLFSRNSVHVDSADSHSTNNSSFSSRRLIPFGWAQGASGTGVSRDPSSPRPASIASSDLARPSTDGGSIWGLPAESNLSKSRLWTSSDGRWHSRNPSRRPSLHGQPSALETSLASPEDEILDDEDLLNPEVSPSQVGVIGSRPPAANLISQRLNPKAPTFMAGLFRKEAKEKVDAKGKSKDKGKEKDKPSASGGYQSADQNSHLAADDSPSDSRKSRDTFSVHTQTSVSESRESLNLDSTLSSTPSEPSMGPSSSIKEQDNVVKKLFRKGSSSRFNLSSRLGKDSSLFKKGPGSTTNSDKNFSADRSSVGDVDDIGDDAAMLGRSLDSVTSSPSLGPAKSRDKEKEGRMNAWRFSMKKKGKDAKESLELDRKVSLSLDSEIATAEEKK
ncbi:hypothetical protein jhhlp_001026 [Lomentospora prolificans]|uniref:Fibronectin type-III domain-containing protein n=1 Tax=Lomentospora prolificans TaxID=41688 RepID=A0A2N3NK71_9PEZI|nr:hypothetical protein jhhlp_001026 [Lomentospora prolificans]